MKEQKCFKAIITLIGISLLLVGTYIHPESFSIEFIPLMILFLVLSTLLERMSIPLAKGSLSLSFAFILCSFYVFQNVVLPVWIVNISIIITQLVFHNRKVSDALFNVGIISSSTLVGGYVFSITGGNWVDIEHTSIIPMVAMVLAILVVNHSILLAFFKLLDKKYNIKIHSKNMRSDFLTYLITVPLGILMASLYTIGYGVTGILIIFVPLATCSYVFRLYKKVDRLNDQLNGLYAVTTEINANLNMQKILENIGGHLDEILNVKSIYILLNEENKILNSVYAKGNFAEYLTDRKVEFSQGATGYCAETKATVYIPDTTKDDRVIPLGDNVKPESLLSVPLMCQDKLIGVITCVKDKKDSFTKTEILLLEIMASQAAVALDNAKAFKEVENMAIIDELTKVYNYRYFQQKIHQEVQKAALDGSSVSLMVIDLDDFKVINDTHGHTAGNKILIDLAQIFRKSIRKYDILFRYGGDEFVVVFPNTDKKTAEIVANRILENVVNTPFVINDDIKEYLSFSAGIAEFPGDADDHLDLMRKADRIMYVGSKEKGKNKVTLYAKKEA